MVITRPGGMWLFISTKHEGQAHSARSARVLSAYQKSHPEWACYKCFISVARWLLLSVHSPIPSRNVHIIEHCFGHIQAVAGPYLFL